MHEGTTDFLKTFVILFAVGLFLWWLRNDFGATYALMAVITAVVLLFGAAMFVFGGMHSHKIQKDTMEGISKFNAQDATIDRFRMQSLKELSKANTYQVKTDSQLKLLEARKELKLLPKQNKQTEETETFWSSNDTVDLDDWS